MYDSTIRLDKRQWIESGMAVPYQQHRFLWTLFPNMPDARGQFRFRIGERPYGFVVLLNSSVRPDYSKLDCMTAETEVRPDIVEGTICHFVVKASPMTRTMGKEVWITDKLRQEGWLRYNMKGAEVTEVSVAPCRLIGVWGRGNSIRVNPVDFKGKLTITDKKEFEQVLDGGLGRKKNYGMGLVVIAEAKGE